MTPPEAANYEPSISKGARIPAATRVRYRVLAVGCGLALLAYLHRLTFVQALPEVETHLHLSKQQLGYLGSAFLLAYALFQVPCGLIGDRLGARHLLAFLICGWSLVTGLTALTGLLTLSGFAAFAVLWSSRFLFGAFQAGFFPLWARVMTDWIPLRERGTAQGAVWMFSRLGGAMGPVFFYWIVQIFRHVQKADSQVNPSEMVRVPAWTVPLWILAAVGVVCGIAFWIWFRNRPEQMPAVSIAEREQIVEGRRDVVSQSAKVPATALFRLRSAWALCIMYGCVGFAGNFTTNLLPVYLQDERHFSAATCAWIMGIPLGFGIVSCALGGFLSDWIARRWGSRKWGRRLNGCVGLACAGIGIVAVPWAEPVWLVAWLLGISFFCNDLNMAPAWAACADVGEQHAGTLSGTMNMVGNLAGAAALAFAGWMLEWGSSRLLFFTFGCSYVLAALCWFAIDVTKPVGFGHNPLPCVVESDATSPLQNENVE